MHISDVKHQISQYNATFGMLKNTVKINQQYLNPFYLKAVEICLANYSSYVQTSVRIYLQQFE